MPAGTLFVKERFELMELRRTVRLDLRDLLKGGATPRILDLYSINQKYGHLDGHAAFPMFENERLNRCFIVKHTVRQHERNWLMTTRPTVTKIILPLAEDDLSMGGYTIAVEEARFAEKVRTMFDDDTQYDSLNADIDRLRELAALPSLDPFLLSERYSRDARRVHPLYFKISQKEIVEMEGAVAEQMQAVVTMAFSSNCDVDDKRAYKFARKLLSDDPHNRMGLFRTALEMSEDEFEHCLLGWKGILYFRWCLTKAIPDLKRFICEVQDTPFVGATHEQIDLLEAERQEILTNIRKCWISLTDTMHEYETVFGRFCSGEDSGGFKSLLRKSPSLFYDLGREHSIISHIPSYWHYWWKHNEKGFYRAREAEEMFASFFASVAETGRRAQTVPDGDLRNRVNSPIPPPPEVIDFANGTAAHKNQTIAPSADHRAQRAG